jgi:hypothetical protein
MIRVQSGEWIVNLFYQQTDYEGWQAVLKETDLWVRKGSHKVLVNGKTLKKLCKALF